MATDTKAAHTPGPWSVAVENHTVDGEACTGFWIRANELTSIAVVIPHEEAEANMCLIAAAPDLLLALKAVSETDDDCPMCDRGRLRNPENTHWPECPFGRAQAVIAKAEGRQSGPAERKSEEVSR